MLGPEQTARRVGQYKWVEMKLFELLGGWAVVTGDVGDEVRVRLGAHCEHHAFHAEVWHRWLSTVRVPTPEHLTVAANPQVELFFSALGDPAEPDATIEKLVGLYRVVLPHLVAAYTAHLNATNEATDAPTVRALKLCLADSRNEWSDGEMILQSLITTEDEVDRACRQQAALTKMLVSGGGVVGLGSISPSPE